MAPSWRSHHQLATGRPETGAWEGDEGRAASPDTGQQGGCRMHDAFAVTMTFNTGGEAGGGH